MEKIEVLENKTGISSREIEDLFLRFLETKDEKDDPRHDERIGDFEVRYEPYFEEAEDGSSKPTSEEYTEVYNDRLTVFVDEPFFPEVSRCNLTGKPCGPWRDCNGCANNIPLKEVPITRLVLTSEGVEKTPLLCTKDNEGINFRLGSGEKPYRVKVVSGSPEHVGYGNNIFLPQWEKMEPVQEDWYKLHRSTKTVETPNKETKGFLVLETFKWFSNEDKPFECIAVGLTQRVGAAEDLPGWQNDLLIPLKNKGWEFEMRYSPNHDRKVVIKYHPTTGVEWENPAK